MRFVEAVVVLVLAVALCAAAVKLLLAAQRQRRLERARWEVVPRSAPDGGTLLTLQKEGEEPLVFRELPPGASQEDFDEALLEAELRRDSLNGMLARRR